MATVTREREEQDGFDEQMRLLRKAARHSEYRGDDDAAEACRWAESRMRHERAAALAAPPVENDIRAAIQGWALYCFKHHGNDAHLYNGLAALGGVDRDGKGWQAQAPPASDPPRLGCESPSNCDPKLDLCTHCQARTAPNGLTPPSWITARQSDPPGLPRYGVTWQEGVSSPLLTPMADGYWTPWHLAAQAIAARQSDPPGLVANWRPIETAPKRTDVLAGWADRPHWLPQVLQQVDAGIWFNGEESDYRPPTHWMPLPASPQAKED